MLIPSSLLQVTRTNSLIMKRAPGTTLSPAFRNCLALTSLVELIVIYYVTSPVNSVLPGVAECRIFMQDR